MSARCFLCSYLIFRYQRPHIFHEAAFCRQLSNGFVVDEPTCGVLNYFTYYIRHIHFKLAIIRVTPYATAFQILY